MDDRMEGKEVAIVDLMVWMVWAQSEPVQGRVLPSDRRDRRTIRCCLSRSMRWVPSRRQWFRDSLWDSSLVDRLSRLLNSPHVTLSSSFPHPSPYSPRPLCRYADRTGWRWTGKVLICVSFSPLHPPSGPRLTHTTYSSRRRRGPEDEDRERMSVRDCYTTSIAQGRRTKPQGRELGSRTVPYGGNRW